MSLPHSSEIITEALPVWKALVDLAAVNITGNTSGMWLAIGSHTQTYLLQHSDQKHRHNRMWDYKPEWGCENIEVINVKQRHVIIMTMYLMQNGSKKAK